MPAGLLSRRGPGLRLRLTLLAAGLVALVSGLLLWLGWVLVGNVAAAVPQLPSGTRVRVHGVEVPGEMLGEALRESAQRQVLVTGGFAFVAVVVAAGLLAWTLTGRLLRPVHEVTATARQLSVESMDERIQLSGPRDEVAELADTFNAMLDRLQAAFESQRRSSPAPVTKRAAHDHPNRTRRDPPIPMPIPRAGEWPRWCGKR